MDETRQVMFSKYPSIENSEKDFIVDKIRKHGYENIDYCITEKIHGSNTQIDYNYKTGEFEYNKRSGAIEEGEHCYNVQDCFASIKENVVELAQYLAPTLKKPLVCVKVFGEIFGGSYPHPDVPRNSKATKVQKGVWYSPDNQWLAFDIAYMVEGDTKTYFLGSEDFFIACGAVDLPTVPLLCITGSLTEALKYPNNKPSTVYKMFKLPEIENNIMEGVVIRPLKGDFWMGDQRVILKNKNDNFKEVSHTPRPDLTLEYSDNVKNALAEADAYITTNRVNNVISHEGEVQEADIGKLIGLTAKDIMEEFEKDSKTWNLLEKVECKTISKHITRGVAKLVRDEVYRRLSEQCK